MLSKKHYIRFAKLFRENKEIGELKNDIISYFEEDNPRFDRERFLKAANLPVCDICKNNKEKVEVKELVPFGRIAYHRECLYEGQYIKII